MYNKTILKYVKAYNSKQPSSALSWPVAQPIASLPSGRIRFAVNFPAHQAQTLGRNAIQLGRLVLPLDRPNIVRMYAVPLVDYGTRTVLQREGKILLMLLLINIIEQYGQIADHIVRRRAVVFPWQGIEMLLDLLVRHRVRGVANVHGRLNGATPEGGR